MLSKKNKHIDSAYEHLKVISRDKDKRSEYEAREKAVRDYNQSMREAAERGFEQGVEVGEQHGEQRGIQIGIEQERYGIAKNMFKAGIDIDTISNVTGLSKETIYNLKKEVEM